MREVRFRAPTEGEEHLTPEGCWILESWNTAEDGAVSIARARVEPGVTTKLHRLDGIVERYVILNGAGLARVGELPPRDVLPGDIVVIPAGVPQQIQNTGETDLVFYCVCTPRFVQDRYESLP